MSAAFVKTAYDQSQTTNNTTTINTIVRVPDQFALRAFNRLAYDREISRPLVASSLLGLPEHYIMPYDVKSINIGLLCSRFHEFAVDGYNQTRDRDNLVVLWQETNTPSSLLDHYSARRACLQNFCLYDYVWVINRILCKKCQPNDIKFADYHRNAKLFVQHHITKNKPSLVKLLGRLYDNMDDEDDLSIDNSNSKNDNIALVLLGLFIPWERFLDYFKEYEVTESTIPSLCWNI